MYLQAMQTDFLQEKGEARYSRVIEIAATRGRVLDRNGEALAVSTPVKSVWAIPGGRRRLAQPTQEARRPCSPSPRRSSTSAYRDTSRDFVYLKRQVRARNRRRSAGAGAARASTSTPEYRRYYPGGEVTAHVIGFTGVDDAGQEGVELAHQATLGGKPGSRRVIRDRLGRIVEDVESIRAAQDGVDLTLSIDGKIQSLAFGALKSAVERHRAKAGAVIALDVRTGEILALANLPVLQPEQPRAPHRRRSCATASSPTSSSPARRSKPFTVALALETGKLDANPRVVHTAPGRLTLANYTIRDVHPAAALTVGQVLARSSNVGAAKIALALPREAMWDLFRRVGFGAAPELGFPGAAAGKLRAYKSWRPIEQATHGLRARHLAQPGAARARLHRVRARRGIGAAHAGQNRRGGERGEGAVGRDRARGARDARAGGAARRHRRRARASWDGASPARPAPRTSRRTAATPPTNISPPSSVSRR